MQTFELINFGSKVLKEKLIPSYKLGKKKGTNANFYE